MTKTEYVTGAESQKQTGEPHAPDDARAGERAELHVVLRRGVRSDAGRGSHDRQADAVRALARLHAAPHAARGRGSCSAGRTRSRSTLKPITRCCFRRSAARRSTNFWNYRKIVRNDIYQPGHKPHEVTLVNWPQNDYWEHNVIDKPAEDVAVYLEESKQLSLSLMYWMQTEAPRHDGEGSAIRGLYLRPDLVGTDDGLAMAPYFRESRRIKAVFTVTENHVGVERATASEGAKPSRSQPMQRRDVRRHRRHRLLPHRPAPDAPAGKTTSTSPRCRFRFRSARCSRCGWRTCCPRARTSASRTSPTAATACTRSSGTSANRPGCWRRFCLAKKIPPARSARNPIYLPSFSGRSQTRASC